jgi:hypothetical protein
LDLIATKKLTTDISNTLVSQGISMSLSSGDVASVTSLVGRVPVFDYQTLDGKCYMRFKTGITFAKCVQGMVYIIPTDDARIKLVITPFSNSESRATPTDLVA